MRSIGADGSSAAEAGPGHADRYLRQWCAGRTESGQDRLAELCGVVFGDRPDRQVGASETTRFQLPAEEGAPRLCRPWRPRADYWKSQPGLGASSENGAPCGRT